MGKVGKAMVMVVSALVGLFAVLIATLTLMSPGRARPIIGEDGRPVPGSISEKAFLEINGDRQGFFLKGRDRTKPVLLYLHGGMPDYFLTERYPTGLENLFVVAWWEQRGSGISYNSGEGADPKRLDTMVDDTIAMANYLRKRFSVNKVYLMAHSGGSFVGVHAARKAPELFAAYVAVSQISNQRESEALAYGYMLDRYLEAGDKAMAKRLERTPVTIEGGTPPAYQMTRDVAMHALGIGTMRDMRSLVTGILLPSLAFPEYSLAEKYHLWAAKARSGIANLWDEVMAADLRKTAAEFELPVYFFHGSYDYTCSYPLAKSYFDSIRAPLKGFYTFSRSAHSPMFEEPEQMRRILAEDVLRGRATMADR